MDDNWIWLAIILCTFVECQVSRVLKAQSYDRCLAKHSVLECKELRP